MKKLAVCGTVLATVDRGSGMPLLLVHGFPLDHSMWDAQIEALCDRYRVIAPDLRGFGQSDVTEAAVTMEQLADDLAGLLDALEVGEPVVLCGLSMGGYVAWAFWRKHAARLRGLVLCDTRAAADSPEAAAGRRETAERVLREGPAVLADSLLPRLLAPQTLELRPEIADRLRGVILNGDRRGIAAASRGMAERPDATPLLPEIRCPTLLLVGAQDVISPVAEMRGLAEKIPGARLVCIDGAGHMAPVERPAETTALVRAFLDQLTESETATGS